jgi:glycosyltransferase involved in cell wall biosynthesis
MNDIRPMQLFDVGDIEDVIARFVREPKMATRCPSSARELALREYTISRMFKQTWDLYNEFVKEHNA